ncbi:redoxin domain-containing protein [Arcticibacter tournemirensis]|uniref:Redoxin domain-containing protein n=1 Tax=Arcticibacter tournemirensis TaxID=699437 RepID=A0A4Q0M4I3_9SPHI|nr:redoxin domain-containing protein [Arcticibacter tournemirensis]RXF67861.1 redoxin domain-containing protein [Arcticibacter tournemirensis]
MNIKIIIPFFALISLQICSYAQSIDLKIHLSGVYSSKISLMPLSGKGALKPMIEKPDVKNNQTVILTVPKDRLPGQFVLRFDYQEKASSAPYPSEKYLFINNQNLELWVRPKAVNNPDSTWFQKEEKENSLFAAFTSENTRRKAQLGLLQNFLMNYDQPGSKFYQNGEEEYGSRRKEYNQWVAKQIEEHSETFVSRIFQFQYVPQIGWGGTETERMNSLMEHYFDMIDLKDPLLAKSADFKDWVNSYVNLYGARATTVALRDSLFTLAGQRAIEKAKAGHPLVYGWMVDYFYSGYEGFNIASGIKMLEPYLQDPRCITTKRLEIEKRLQGIETIRPGTVAPDFATTDASGKPVQFHRFTTTSPYKLVMFWSADCQHCKELVEKLYPWYQKAGGKKMMEVFAISVDFTDTEIKVWEDAKLKLTGWKHSRANGGINSPEASAYYILSTPVLVLVDSKTNKIVALPEKVEDLEKAVRR